ncbi:zinc-binding alcohol dehydrogenase family protein [Saliterribacillus persicus]|uniref:NADPH:quinone reductase-like Zn-dependent oxidoreductase n=1 Tax=Saliterribacillus persicus TaxID=930114 RepID=A0A368X9M2_9BACI|nr:zinc-binding alcohol dehydrogenase family protein [Saliterribacillus persicus]RCW63147.1 NADPH:quinone reductase-like Zn-dependent oxidoreductase [Saliterribacillus persicus]
MKAIILERACTAEELTVKNAPIPEVKSGWVLIKIKAFGINRSELFTREGFSPSVKLPRIIGIECVGEIADPSDSDFSKGEKVVSLMGGLGREFDGSYAEYALIPSNQIYRIDHNLDWVRLAAIPEMYYTAYASLFDTMMLQKGDTLLIRGGTSSVGLAALQLAKSIGVSVISTTRSKNKVELLKRHGADYVLLDENKLQPEILSLYPNGINKILELIGTVTLKDSLSMLADKGTLCMAGILGGEWVIDQFEPMIDIPSGRYFTQFDSGVNFKEELLKDLFQHIIDNQIEVPIGKIFTLDEISEAHKMMESNRAEGKIVVVNP